MNEKIAILDDEKDIVELLAVHLRKNAFIPKEFYHASELFDFLTREIPDLIILDLMLPDMDGIDICRKIKNDPRLKIIPIIMLSARQEETDKILGLELGADDYITKPFSPKEVVTRVRVVLRRGRETVETEIIEIAGKIKIDLKRYVVYNQKNETVELTPIEFKILITLAMHRGWVFSRDKLLDSVWGDNRYVIDRTVDVHIKHLREKLQDAGDIIKNVRGVGYKLEE